MKQKKQKKKTWVIVPIVILVLAVVIAVFLWTQRDNLKALQYAKYTAEERQLMMEENQAYIEEILGALPIDDITPLTKDQEAMYHRGEITEEDALQIIMGKSEDAILTEDADDKTSSKGNSGADAQTSASGTKQEKSTKASSGSVDQDGENNGRLQELVAKVYLLRSSFTGQIDGLIEQAKQEYIAKVKAEGKANKMTIATQYMNQGLELEKDCDAQMETILSEIAEEIALYGGDENIVDEIRTAYETEKSIKKADLVTKYTN